MMFWRRGGSTITKIEMVEKWRASKATKICREWKKGIHLFSEKVRIERTKAKQT